MPTVFEKLNLKDQKQIVILKAPASFEYEIAALKSIAVHRDLKGAPSTSFVLAFATRKSEVDALAAPIAAQAQGDAIVWFAYPKGTSKKLKCDFNRDNGWNVLEAAGFETVRIVAIDDDWSALRFRRAEFVKAR